MTLPRVKGVTHLVRERAYRAYISIQGKKYEGYFSVLGYGSEKDAYEAAVQWRRKMEQKVMEQIGTN